MSANVFDLAHQLPTTLIENINLNEYQCAVEVIDEYAEKYGVIIEKVSSTFAHPAPAFINQHLMVYDAADYRQGRKNHRYVAYVLQETISSGEKVLECDLPLMTKINKGTLPALAPELKTAEAHEVPDLAGALKLSAQLTRNNFNHLEEA